MNYYYNFHGEHHEGKNVDQVLREYFPDFSYKGVFFDIGAYDPIHINNSYHFEKNGWDCYCFEANTDLIPKLKENRKNVFNYAISDSDKEEITFHVVNYNGWTAGFSAINLSEEYKKIFSDYPQECIIKIKVPQKTLNSIIENDIKNFTKIDIISIDVEGGELDVLKGLDLNKYRPKLFIIENLNPNNQSILEHMNSFGYKLDKQIMYNQYYIQL
jgi:FkbM family methyltransferase